MKRLIVTGMLLVLAAASGWAQQDFPYETERAERRQREIYADTARLRLHAIKVDLDAQVAAAPAERERLQPVFAAVKRGEELVLRLRSASSTEVEPLKAMIDRNREEIDRLLGREPRT